MGCFFGAVYVNVKCRKSVLNHPFLLKHERRAAFSLGERLGRKKSILLGTTVMSLGAILQISSYSVAQMIGTYSIFLGGILSSETCVESVYFVDTLRGSRYSLNQAILTPKSWPHCRRSWQWLEHCDSSRMASRDLQGRLERQTRGH